ncbi:Bystin [Trichinella pseudospiralis]
MRLLVLSDRNRGPPPDLPSESDVPLFYHLDKRTLRNHARASWNQQNAEFSQLHLYYQENFFSVANLLISTRILGTVDYTTLEEESFSDNSSPDPTSRSFQLRESIELAVYKRSRPRHMVPKDLEGHQARCCDTAKRYPLQALTSDRPEDERADKKEVHIVINMGNYHRFFGTGIRKACLIDPVEVKTVLGCIVCGPVVSRNQCSAVKAFHRSTTYAIASSIFVCHSCSESLAFEMEKLYQEGIMFDETRSSVRLLWKNSELNFPNDFYMLKRWLEALERRLARKSSAVNVYPRQANTIRLQDMDNGVSERLKICSGRDRKGKMEPLGIFYA